MPIYCSCHKNTAYTGQNNGYRYGCYFLLMHKTGKSIVLRNLGIGSIIASVRCREYAMTHPFVGYSAYDGVKHCVYYYTIDTHKKFEWPDKMMNVERLVSALRADRTLKNNLKI